MDKDLEYAINEAKVMNFSFDQAIRFIMRNAKVTEQQARASYYSGTVEKEDKYQYDVL
jgi:hypothetical protein